MRHLFEGLRADLGEWLPPALGGHLAELDGSGLWLTLDNAMDLPWEWAQIGANCLWQTAMTAIHACDPPPPRPGRLLVVADPQGVLPWTRQEAVRIQRRLQGRTPVDLLQGPQATREAVLEALNSGRYLWTHLATLSLYEPENPYCSQMRNQR